MKAKVTRRNIFLLSTPTIIVAIIAATLFWFFDRMKTADSLRMQTTLSLSTSQKLLSLLVDSELGIRGYILTKDKKFLLPYITASHQIGNELDQLRAASNNNDNKFQIYKISRLVNQQITFFAATVADSNILEPDNLLLRFTKGDGSELMDDIRSALQAYNVIQNSQLQQYRNDHRKYMNYLFTFIVLVSICMLFFAQAFAYGIYRNIHQRLMDLVHLETKRSLDKQEVMNQQLNLAYVNVQDSERKLEVTLNSIADAVIATDCNACVTLMNHVAAELTASSIERAQGNSICDFFNVINKETRQPVLNPVLETLLHGVAQGASNNILILPNGIEYIIAHSCAPIRDHDGQVIGAVLVFRDVTAENTAQQALLESDARVRLATEATGVGIWELNLSDNRMRWDQQMFRIYGVEPTADGIVSRDLWVRHLLPEDRIAQEGWDKTIHLQERRSREFHIKPTGSDEIRYIRSVSTLRTDARGNAESIIGTNLDITEIKHTEDILRESERHLRAVIDALPVAIYATDAEGNITHFNQAAVDFSGYVPELGNDNWCKSLRLYHPDGSPMPYDECPMAIAIKEGRPLFGIEAIAERPHKSRIHFMVYPTPLRDGSGKIIGGINMLIDISERKRLDQVLLENNIELNKAKNLAEKANRAKSDFLSNMSHELRTPLNAILGFAQLIDASNPPLTASQKRSVAQILQAGWYLLDLINEILDLTLIESGRLPVTMEMVSLPELMHECRTMVEPQALNRNISLHFPEFNSPFIVNADATRLKQVLINLLSNAIKYNRIDGKVMVSCVEYRPGYARIIVEDTGEGLSPEQVAQLFQPFNRLGKENSNEEGTGIGLVMTKRLIKLMGGKISVESEVGKGTLFSIELSMGADIPATISDKGPVVEQRNLRAKEDTRHTLLYVEDNQANLTLIEDIIASRPDFFLLTARDAFAGIELARLAQPDLILMDINLPGMSGTEALAVLRKDSLTQDIPVIALSANAIPRDIEKGLEAGFFHYLTKPVRVNELMDTLDAAVEMVRKKTSKLKKRKAHEVN